MDLGYIVCQKVVKNNDCFFIVTQIHYNLKSIGNRVTIGAGKRASCFFVCLNKIDCRTTIINQIYKQVYLNESRWIMLADIKIESKNNAFETLAIPHIDSLYRFAFHITGNEFDAEDLVQNTYLRAYKFFDKFRDGTNCKAWLLKILRNTFINSFHRNKGCDQTFELLDNAKFIEALPFKTTPEDEIFADLLEDEIVIAIDALPVNFKTVILLADIEQLSYREISEIINRPIGTVMSRLHRGRKMLRKKLQNYAAKYGFAVPNGDCVI